MGHTKNFIRYCHVADFGTRRRRRRLPPPLRVPSSQVRRCGPTPSPPRATSPTPPPHPPISSGSAPFPFSTSVNDGPLFVLRVRWIQRVYFFWNISYVAIPSLSIGCKS